MFVKIVIGNLYSRIVGVLDEPLKYLLEKRLTYRLKSAWYIAGNVNRKRRDEAKKLGVKLHPEDLWDGSIQLFIPEEQKFFTGMMTEVTSILNQAGYTFTFAESRNLPVKLLKNLTFTAPPDKPPRPYQDFTVQECLKATRGVIHAATGSGKTYIVSNLIGEIKASPFIFLVLSIDLLEQAHQALSETLNEPIGRIGSGQVDIQRINVMTIQTAIRALHRKDPKFKLDDYQYDEEDVWSEEDPEDPEVMKRAEEIENLIRSAKGVYFDEVHHAAATTVKEVLFAAKDAYWRFGGSATPFREDGAEMMIQGLFGKRLVEIKPSWLIQKGYLVRPYIFNVKLKDGSVGEYDSYRKIYQSCIVENQELNKLTADIAAFLKSRGVSSLTLVQQYKQGYNIRDFAPDMPFIKGDMAKKKRRDSIQSMRDGQITAAIATTLADEGLDVPRLGGVIVAGGGKSITRVYQRIGRVLRPFPGKNAAIAVVFQHDGNHIEDHGKRVKRILEDEPEFCVKDSTPDDILYDLSKVLDKDDTLFGQIV